MFDVGGLGPSVHGHSAKRKALNVQRESATGKLIPVNKLAHVAPRNAELFGQSLLLDTGSDEEVAKLCHASQVCTERTFMQEQVRSVRFGNVRERWHHANMGLRIKELRKTRGLTGEQLAELVNVSKGCISELENDKKTPGAGLVLRLADALKVEVYELYEGTLKEQQDAALRAHMEVMQSLPDEDRDGIVRLAVRLASKRGE